MNSDGTGKPPAPVIGAAAIYALLALGPLIVALVAIIGGEPKGALFALLAILPGAIALGLWQGNRGARVMAIFFGFVTLLLGIVMIFLLAMPRSSRAWFTPAVD